jgi:hypothetical protein
MAYLVESNVTSPVQLFQQLHPWDRQPIMADLVESKWLTYVTSPVQLFQQLCPWDWQSIVADLVESTWLNLPLAVGLGIVFHACGLLLYRLCFSPIAAFPGPLLARATFWYEFYHNFVKDGQYYRRIAEMHQKYGIFQFFLSINLPLFLSSSLPYLTLKQAQLLESRLPSSISWIHCISTRFLFRIQSESRTGILERSKAWDLMVKNNIELHIFRRKWMLTATG